VTTQEIHPFTEIKVILHVLSPFLPEKSQILKRLQKISQLIEYMYVFHRYLGQDFILKLAKNILVHFLYTLQISTRIEKKFKKI
jgi:hypothetical protein